MRLYLSTCLFLLLISSATDGQTKDERARAILKSVSDRINDAGDVRWDFSLTISYPDESDTQFTGKYYQSTDRFRLDVPEYLIVCDGTNQWNVDKHGKQITIYDHEPSGPDDLANPSNLLKIYDHPDFDYFLDFEGKQNGLHLYRVEFKPLSNNSDIFKIKLEILSPNYDIHKVEAFYKNGINYTLNIEESHLNQNLPSSTFSVDTKSFPGFHVEDLRF